MTRHMSSSIFCGLGKSHGVGIFAKSEGPGIYPENYNLKDTPQCHSKFVITKLFINDIYNNNNYNDNNDKSTNHLPFYQIVKSSTKQSQELQLLLER